MNANLSKVMDNPNETLTGLIANLEQMQTDRNWHQAIGVGSFSYAEGIKDAIEAIKEYQAINRRIKIGRVKNG
ncbi:MAG: hypothetical protein EOO20_05100 [Chryseobacterium sp.]|nr:MAG: hypothetical protein EOO20_05100 [Chryseobacterium sp.]